MQTIPNVPPHKEGVNPATWMLEISTPGQEKRTGVDFAEHYDQSEQYRYEPDTPWDSEVLPKY